MIIADEFTGVLLRLREKTMKKPKIPEEYILFRKAWHYLYFSDLNLTVF